MKLDVSAIEGYANLSPEEKVKALEGLDLGSMYVSKATFDKTASELSNAKKELASKMSAEEAKALEAAEEVKKIQDENLELKRKLSITENTAKLLSIGYDTKLAQDTAVAMADGLTDVVLANQEKFREAIIAQTKAELLKSSPTPSGGGGTSTMTKEKLSKMSLEERSRFALEQPEAYKEIYK